MSDNAEHVDTVQEVEIVEAKEKYYFHWFVIFMVIVAIIGVGYCGWHFGYQSADNKWITAHNTEVKGLNDKITSIEKTSKATAATLQATVLDLESKLKKASSSAPVIVAHDSTGQVLSCNGKAIVPYLGASFTDTWNRMNDEGAAK